MYIFLLEIITTKQKPIVINDNIEQHRKLTADHQLTHTKTSVISDAPKGYAHHAILWHLSCCLCMYKCAIKSYSVGHVHEKMMECGHDNLKISTLTADRICVNLKDKSRRFVVDCTECCKAKISNKDQGNFSDLLFNVMFIETMKDLRFAKMSSLSYDIFFCVGQSKKDSLNIVTGSVSND